MITLQNMIFANPQAYQVFPNMVNTYNTGTIEEAVYTGHIVITDSSGNTHDFTNTSTIDFNNISGIVTIDNITNTGSVQLGRWNITSSTPEPEPGSDSKKASEAVAGDAVLYDETNAKLVIVDNTKLEDYTEGYTPIGVVVVPGTHNVYGDCSCGVMSLKPMNCSTPATGGTYEQSMYWGVYGTDISTLPNLNQAPIVGSGSNVGNVDSTVTGQDDYPYLPSDRLSAVQCPHDIDAYYYSSSSSYNQAPSPYLTNGSRNPAYYQTTSPSSSNNCLANFDGRGNTDKIITQRGNKEYTSWKPSSSSEADYPAASCCDMFYTEGTQQGDWYLPAMGELGYIMPPFNKINEAITKMRNAYGTSVGVTLGTSENYWSSSEYNSRYARIIYTDTGRVYYYFKSSYGRGYARAFLRVKDSNNKIDIVR